MHFMYDSYQLALVLVGMDPKKDEDFDDEDDKLDDLLYEKYGIDDPDKFDVLMKDLIKMVDVGQSPLTDKIYKGFSQNGNEWLMKIEVPVNPPVQECDATAAK